MTGGQDNPDVAVILMVTKHHGLVPNKKLVAALGVKGTDSTVNLFELPVLG